MANLVELVVQPRRTHGTHKEKVLLSGGGLGPRGFIGQDRVSLLGDGPFRGRGTTWNLDRRITIRATDLPTGLIESGVDTPLAGRTDRLQVGRRLRRRAHGIVVRDSFSLRREVRRGNYALPP